MNRVDRLLQRYEDFVGRPWERSLAGVQRVWFVVYDKTDERRLRVRLTEFELATRAAGHGWTHVDLTDSFAAWLGGHEYSKSYFENPEDLGNALPAYGRSVAGRIAAALAASAAGEDAVVAVSGIGTLFGLVSVSEIVQAVVDAIPGRLVVFFPGEHADNNYRLLDAKDGWNYMAIPITAFDGDQT